MQPETTSTTNTAKPPTMPTMPWKDRVKLVESYMAKHNCTYRAAKALVALDYPQYRWYQR